MQATDEALLSLVRSRRVHRWLIAIAVLLAAIVSIRSSIIDVNLVPSGSMEPTIKTGDHILINKLAYDLKIPLTRIHLFSWSNPRVGDVVVFRSPQGGITLVKRVVAVGGDQVAMNDDVLIRNGKAMEYSHDSGSRGELVEKLGNKPHLIETIVGKKLSFATFASLTVPSGMYFVLGDNRDFSADSRVLGCVPRSYILGRVMQ